MIKHGTSKPPLRVLGIERRDKVVHHQPDVKLKGARIGETLFFGQSRYLEGWGPSFQRCYRLLTA